VFAKWPRFEFKLKIAISLHGVFFMPIFEYVCKECEHEFEALVFGKQKAECPKCQSRKLEPQLSIFAVSAKSGAAIQPSMPESAGPCGSCGDARGPGACSLKDLD
jgi:putative FmdB family regulatory protein